MLMKAMQDLTARFSLHLAITGPLNTVIKDNIAWPIMYAGCMDVSTGEVFTAKFSYHGPDTDIRSLRLRSPIATITNIYDHHTGKCVIQPFEYQVMLDAPMWLQRTDSFILSHCSTSPLVEPPHFCENIRAVLRRMISDPQPKVTLFSGGRSRVYTLSDITGLWVLEGGNMTGSGTENYKIPQTKHWGVNDFMMCFK